MPRTKKSNVSVEEAIELKLNTMASQTGDEAFLAEDNQLVELIMAERLSKKLKTELVSMENPSRDEMKRLVALYYQMQDNRMALRNQVRAIENKTKNSNSLILDWATKNFTIIELGVKDALEIVTDNNEVGRWLTQIVGIGSVLAAGCLAYFDIEGKQYASQFHNYAGLNDNNRPWIGRVGAEKMMAEVLAEQAKNGEGNKITDDTVIAFAAKTQWKYDYLRDKAFNEDKGSWSKADLIAAAAKIPYNADLKVLCYKIGSSFAYQVNNPKSLYGRLLAERKVLETQKNENKEFADQAKAALEAKNIGKNTIAYSAYSKGMLPKAHIAARARRWVTKLFISHLFEEMYRVRYHKKPAPYYSLVPEHNEGAHNKYIEPEVPFFKVPDDK